MVAGATGMAVSVGAAWGLKADTNPILAIADTVRDHVPGGIGHWLIEQVGHADKPLLVTGTVIGGLVLCALAGLLWARRRPVAVALLIALGVVGFFAVRAQPHAGGGAVVGDVLGVVVWVVVLNLLSTQLRAQGLAGDASRRQFVGYAGVALVAGAVLLGGGRLLSHGQRAVQSARTRLRLPLSRGRAPADAEVGVPGIEPWRTPNAAFYRIDTSLSPPQILPEQWSLRIHGMVENELHLSYDDLVQRQLSSAWVTLCCVSNPVGGPLISNAYWTGVLARQLLAEAKPHPDANAVLQTSYDGWTAGTPLSALTDDRNAMLALGMNGQPLPVEHGFPVRMVVPGLYGYVSATKWLVDLEVSRFDRFQAYWTREGWSPQGPVKTESRIDVPRAGQDVPAGRMRVGGSAWAQHTGIKTVEYQLDGGPWQRAELGGVPDDNTWVQWAGTVQLRPGHHELRVRATDKSGYTQTAAIADVVPNGATGWDTVRFAAS